jgi:hypothetical protein
MTVFVPTMFVPARQQPAEADVRAALERVVTSPGFTGSRRLSAFLRYVVERALDGHGDRLKGYTIAVEALGRPPSFDPQIDPIVRVEAGRLRRALDRFYAGAGRDEPVLIGLPLGSYVPTFRWRAQVAGRLGPSREDSAALTAMVDLLIERRRALVREMQAEIETMPTMRQRARDLAGPG